jgi:hypothetical protein
MSPSVAMVTVILGLDGLTDGIKIYRMVDGFLLLMFSRVMTDILERRNFQKSPSKGRKGVYEENSDFRGKKNNRQGKKHKEYWLLFRQLSSDNFQRHVIQ